MVFRACFLDNHRPQNYPCRERTPLLTVLTFVRLDNQHTGRENDKGQEVERSVGAGANDLLASGPRRLEDEDGLCQDEHADALEERVRAEERNEGRVLKDGGPDEGDEQDGAALSQPAGA